MVGKEGEQIVFAAPHSRILTDVTEVLRGVVVRYVCGMIVAFAVAKAFLIPAPWHRLVVETTQFSDIFLHIVGVGFDIGRGFASFHGQHQRGISLVVLVRTVRVARKCVRAEAGLGVVHHRLAGPEG